MNKIDPSKISIICINIYKSSISTTETYLNNPVAMSSTKVGFAQETGFNFEEKKIRIRLNIALDGVDNKSNTIGLSGEFGFEFQLLVSNLEEFLEKEEEKTKVNGELGATLMGIIYSTARGIILERTQNTYLRGIILPVIDPGIILGSKIE